LPNRVVGSHHPGNPVTPPRKNHGVSKLTSCLVWTVVIGCALLFLPMLLFFALIMFCVMVAVIIV